MTRNDQMIAFWNGLGGETWAQNADEQDRELDDLGAATLEVLAPVPGEAVLDVGCGPGTTTFDLAGRVGPAGRVVGVDISAPLLTIARSRAAGRADVAFVEADAQTTIPVGAPFDAVFSRFGVMFFDDPGAAFANLRRAATSDGRLAFVCWQRPEENPWFLEPLRALAGIPGVEVGPPPDPDAPGPFTFADRDRIRQILTTSGWHSVSVRDHRDQIVDDRERRVAFSLRQGPAARALAGADASVVAEATARVRDALDRFVTDGIVRLPRASWIVTASAVT